MPLVFPSQEFQQVKLCIFGQQNKGGIAYRSFIYSIHSPPLVISLCNNSSTPYAQGLDTSIDPSIFHLKTYNITMCFAKLQLSILLHPS